MNGPNFALYYAGDAYSTAGKIMGRQSAGKALMKGVARRWPDGEVHAFGNNKANAGRMVDQLKADGFTGAMRWRQAPGDAALDRLGAVYYPAPVPVGLAHARNARGPASYSLFGVTHTLSSDTAMDQVAAFALTPFKPWDGLICTSSVALSVVTKLQAELRDWQAEHLGATRFNTPALPVIPLGVDAPGFARNEQAVAEARKALGLSADEVAFLFAGRLIFHGKAHPVAMYRGLEAAAQRTRTPLVCIEAGVFPNPHMTKSYRAARAELAPSVRFIEIDGSVQADYDNAWKAADVFISLSDNIQETFGLTPVEAMAAGLPVIVSDWNGYKDTVRDGVDGYRIATVVPAADAAAGADLAARHAQGLDTYDFFIGRVCMTTVVDIDQVADRVLSLADDPALRRRLGAAGRSRVEAEFDWPLILDRYCAFADSLAELRRAAVALKPMLPVAQPLRPDPFALFSDYPTRVLSGDWRVVAEPLDARGVDRFLDLAAANFVLHDQTLPAEAIRRVHAATVDAPSVSALLRAAGGATPVNHRALMWLAKLGVVRFAP